MLHPYLLFNAGFQFSYIAIFALNHEVIIKRDKVKKEIDNDVEIDDASYKALKESEKTKISKDIKNTNESFNAFNLQQNTKFKKTYQEDENDNIDKSQKEENEFASNVVGILAKNPIVKVPENITSCEQYLEFSGDAVNISDFTKKEKRKYSMSAYFINMLDESGNLPNFVNEPDDLLGTSLTFRVELKSCLGLPEFFNKNIRVEYTSFHDNNIYKTKVYNLASIDGNVDINESFTHTIEYLTQDDIDFLIEDKLCIKVYGYEEVVKKGKKRLPSREEILRAVKRISDRLSTEMWISLNELQYELGLSNTDDGEILGFTVDEGIDVDWGVTLTPNGEPCQVVEFTNELMQYHLYS